MRTDPSPGRDGGVRFRFRIGRGAIMCLLFTAVIWIAASLLFHPPEGAGDRLGVVAMDPSAATGANTTTGTPGPASETAPPASPAAGQGNGPSPSASGTPAATVVVHVAGAVRKPGVYRFASGARAGDAVRKAGGMTAAAVASAVNLAAPLQDGQQLYLPTQSEVATSGAEAPAAGPAADDKSQSINVNTADATELQELPGIGPALSARIIEFRNANGAFSSLDELDAVSGIGPAMMATLQPLVRFR